MEVYQPFLFVIGLFLLYMFVFAYVDEWVDGAIAGKVKKMVGRVFGSIYNRSIAIKMHNLCCAIIKLDYLHHICHIQAVTDDKYRELYMELRMLEKDNPKYVKLYSPTKRFGFHESDAKLAFGKQWAELKRTWNLLKKDS